jgi:hypothetical protein
MVAGVPPEIRTQYLLDTGLGLYRYVSLLGLPSHTVVLRLTLRPLIP